MVNIHYKNKLQYTRSMALETCRYGYLTLVGDERSEPAKVMHEVLTEDFKIFK